MPLSIALNPQLLKSQVTSKDTLAVFGSSHSAILAIKNIIENTEAKVINFYRSQLRYAVYLDDNILFDTTGLKGVVANFAKKNFHGKTIANLQRFSIFDIKVNTYIALCNKAVYGVGFTANPIDITSINSVICDRADGIIAPGLFGCGIAFSYYKQDAWNNLEPQVGLCFFNQQLSDVMPIWRQYGLT